MYTSTRIPIVLLLLLAAVPTTADPLGPYRWENRVLLLFGPIDTAELASQRQILATDPEGLEDRHMVVLGPSETQNLQSRFKVDPAGFTAILVGKDGGEKLRGTDPVSLEELYALIDQMPMRRREIRQQYR